MNHGQQIAICIDIKLVDFKSVVSSWSPCLTSLSLPPYYTYSLSTLSAGASGRAGCVLFVLCNRLAALQRHVQNAARRQGVPACLQPRCHAHIVGGSPLCTAQSLPTPPPLLCHQCTLMCDTRSPFTKSGRHLRWTTAPAGLSLAAWAAAGSRWAGCLHA